MYQFQYYFIKLGITSFKWFPSHHENEKNLSKTPQGTGK